MQFVISVNLKCALLIGMTSFIVTSGLFVSVFFLTINHAVDVDRLQGILDEHTYKLQQMTDHNELKFEETNISIYYDVGTLRTETNQQFEETNATLFSKVEQLRIETNEQLDDTNTSLYSEIETLRSENDLAIQNITIQSVAFEALALNATDPQNQDTLLYTNVTTNEGSCYNNSTGLFTAPVNGIYLFLVQACITSSNQLCIGIMAGESVKNMTFYSHNSSSCFTGSLVTNMTTGSTASVVSYSNHSTVFNETSYTDNSFSGFLINNIY